MALENFIEKIKAYSEVMGGTVTIGKSYVLADSGFPSDTFNVLVPISRSVEDKPELEEAIAVLKDKKFLGFFRLLYRFFPIRDLAAVGMMGFTNYLMQSLLLATLFYGFSLFGEVFTWQTFVISLTVFIVQFLYSSVYMSRFRTGPLESVWRSVYKR
ncbi:DUF418 domain-containing protein [Bacillus sp. JCM 19041]|uniref:DUF418 domain-containing protein n=1 Tax=Bacillus sp. JCM 19041 TaxID=1460637 RepID=UPI0018D00277